MCIYIHDFVCKIYDLYVKPYTHTHTHTHDFGNKNTLEILRIRINCCLKRMNAWNMAWKNLIKENRKAQKAMG